MDKIEFLQGFLRSPFEVGSIIPSSQSMVNKVMYHVEQTNPKTIVELGAGTGVFTKKLHEYAGDNDSSLLIFEKDKQMRSRLQQSMSTLNLYHDATELPQTLSEQHKAKADCIVCGLPFTLFSKEKTDKLLRSIHNSLADNGCFIMYQYSTHMKNRLTELYGDVSLHLVLLNIPPAFVYVCKKN